MSKERWIEIKDTINFIDEHIEIRNCSAKYICNKLNDQEHRIAELEEQLANSIRPKFKVGQKVFVVIQDIVRTTSINSFRVFENNELSYYCKYVDNERMYLELDENEVFATLDEAKSKLKELRGVV